MLKKINQGSAFIRNQALLQKKPLALTLAGMLLSSAVGSASAHQAQVMNWRIADSLVSGVAAAGITRGGDTQLKIELNNDDHHPVLVLFDQCAEERVPSEKPLANLEQVLNEGADPVYVRGWQTPSPRWRLCTKAGGQAMLLDPESVSKLPLSLDFLQLGNARMNPHLEGKVYVLEEDYAAQFKTKEDLVAFYSEEKPSAHLDIELYYQMTGERWQQSNFEDIFPTPSRGEAAATTDYVEVAATLPVSLQSYRTNRPLPELMTDDDGDLLQKTLQEALGSGVSSFYDDSSCFDCSGGPKDLPLGEINPGDIPLGSDYQIKGRLSAVWGTDLAAHPGYGFTVSVYGNTLNGWKRLGGAYVASNGNWNIKVDGKMGYLGGDLEVRYYAGNRYIQPVTSSGNNYSWKDPKYYVNTQIFDVGHRMIDTIALYGWGVPELMDTANQLWTKLEAVGINPLRTNSYTVVYPNTNYDCGRKDNVPWSCASTDGKIWLISKHGTQPPVVAHELAHQLNFKYWNNMRPAKSGGKHNFSSCYSDRTGMTLLEGFADFITAWVGYPDRNTAAGNFNVGDWNLGFDAEGTGTTPNCVNGEENEVWVARTFWDLHDKHSDGSDAIWFNHPGAVISLYLSNGVSADGEARDMRYYRDVYEKAAGSQFQSFISDIFDLNRM